MLEIMLRVLVIDESSNRAAEICAGLAIGGHQVAAVLPSALDLIRHVEAVKPDVILIHADSPSRDTLEHLSVLGRDSPKPVMSGPAPRLLRPQPLYSRGVSAHGWPLARRLLDTRRKPGQRRSGA